MHIYIIYKYIHYLLPDIPSSRKKIPILVEGCRHDTISHIEGLFHPIPVVDVDVDVQYPIGCGVWKTQVHIFAYVHVYIYRE